MNKKNVKAQIQHVISHVVLSKEDKSILIDSINQIIDAATEKADTSETPPTVEPATTNTYGTVKQAIVPMSNLTSDADISKVISSFNTLFDGLKNCGVIYNP